ncbi:MAG: hypothetical protein ACYSYT_09240 [Planctomycetota bacterium]|jgi:hypothetical protein
MDPRQKASREQQSRTGGVKVAGQIRFVDYAYSGLASLGAFLEGVLAGSMARRLEIAVPHCGIIDSVGCRGSDYEGTI